MGKNVLIISGSPRKNGNSDILCEEFKKGAEQLGNTVEKIFIAEKEINYCSGCGVCVNNKGTCSIEDDMEEILDRMEAADVIVLATPIYFYTMDGQMKTFIDRICSRYTTINNKEFYFIMTMADEDKANMERTVEEFRGFTMCLDNPKEKGIIYGVGAWKKGEIKATQAMFEAYEMGMNV